jgi:xanthine dehydrogenase accessory factor
MKELAHWAFLLTTLEQDKSAALMVVVDSQGSSPGRQGFMMVIAQDGTMAGSIGGGIMEHKLVELLRDRLSKRLPMWELRRQVHSKQAVQDQSGMICSGEQSIALLILSTDHIPTMKAINDRLEAGEKVLFQLDKDRMIALDAPENEHPMRFQQQPSGEWSFQAMLGMRDIAHVIGAGHVGLAMCKILASLDFFVINYDDRPDLNTMQANKFADRKVVTRYEELHKFITSGDNVFVFVMTFGYRGDDQAVRALIGKKFKYFGMMGSEAKVTKLLSELLRDGYAPQDIDTISAPAGLVAHCKSPTEIAVSIAAEALAAKYASDPRN